MWRVARSDRELVALELAPRAAVSGRACANAHAHASRAVPSSLGRWGAVIFGWNLARPHPDADACRPQPRPPPPSLSSSRSWQNRVMTQAMLGVVQVNRLARARYMTERHGGGRGQLSQSPIHFAAEVRASGEGTMSEAAAAGTPTGAGKRGRSSAQSDSADDGEACGRGASASFRKSVRVWSVLVPPSSSSLAHSPSQHLPLALRRHVNRAAHDQPALPSPPPPSPPLRSRSAAANRFTSCGRSWLPAGGPRGKGGGWSRGSGYGRGPPRCH